MRKIASLLAVPLLVSLLVLSTSPSAVASGSNGGSGGGGNKPPATSGPIGNVGLTPMPLVATQPNSVFVSFTFNGPTPAAGVDLTLRSNDPAVVVPATFRAPGGVFNVEIPIMTSDVPTSRTVSVTVSSGSQSKVATATLLPAHPVLVAPQLQTPGDGAGFGFRQQIRFQWSAQANVAYYDVQVASDPAFTSVVAEGGPPTNVWGADYFGGAGSYYWRVRGMDGLNNAGPWSSVRRFTSRPQ